MLEDNCGNTRLNRSQGVKGALSDDARLTSVAYIGAKSIVEGDQNWHRGSPLRHT